MEKRGWRNVAIVFMVLLALETLFMIWAYSVGTSYIDKENICAYNICRDDPEITYYEYFDYEDICECYDIDMNVIKQEYLGG